MDEIISAMIGVSLMGLQFFFQLVLPVLNLIASTAWSLLLAAAITLGGITLTVVALALHVVCAVILSHIAKTYGVRSRWMAWFPILNAHLLGAVADVRRERAGKKPLRLSLWLTVAVSAFLAIPGICTVVAACLFTVACLVYTALINIGALILIGCFVLLYLTALCFMLSPEVGMVLCMLAFFGVIFAIIAVASFMDLLGTILTLVQWILPLTVLGITLLCAAIAFIIYLITACNFIPKGRRALMIILSVIFPPFSPVLLAILREKNPA